MPLTFKSGLAHENDEEREGVGIPLKETYLKKKDKRTQRGKGEGLATRKRVRVLRQEGIPREIPSNALEML